MTPDVSIIAAFVAGVLSITSPCVLPLLPLYLAHLGGTAAPNLPDHHRRTLFVNAFAYVAGFSAVFVMLGVAIGAASSLVSAAEVVSSNRYWLVRIGGVLLVILGLHQIGLIRIPYLAREHRFTVETETTSRAFCSFLIGVTFAAGWSPCAGPVLGAILTMAAGEASVTRSAMLLSIYSIGLAVPFLAVAAFGSTQGILTALRPRLAAISNVSGAILLATGTLMLLGIYQQFFTRMVAAAPWTPWEPRL